MKANITAPNANELISLLKSEIKDALGDMDKFVTVGIHEDKNSRYRMNFRGIRKKRLKRGRREATSMTNAEIGAANHFGTSTIPARPWLDVGVDTGTRRYIREIEKAAANNIPLDMALERVGLIAQGMVQKYIRQLQDPPNAESTIKKKKSANPLIDTGQMRQSVSYKVTPVKPSEGIG